MRRYLWLSAILITFIVAISPRAAIQTQTGVVNLLQNKNAREKANIKSQEIAKLGPISRILKGKYEIEITSLRPIEGGIEFYVRAWDFQGKPIALGNGVEKEHFRIFNPPILIPDINGSVVKKVFNVETKRIEQRRWREDLREALLQSVEHTIFVSYKKGVVPKTGSVGSTTDTFFPDADPETTTVDGEVNKRGPLDWTSIRTATTGFSANPTGENASVGIQTDSTQWFQFYRFIALFDTSAIPDTDTINSATLSLFGAASPNDGFSQSVVIIDSNPASNTDLVADDYFRLGNLLGGTATKQSDTAIPITGGWSSGAYNDFPLNATGLGNISKTGVSKFGSVVSGDQSNTEPGFIANAVSQAFIKTADTLGTTQDPKLVVVHSTTIPIPDSASNLWQKRSFEGKGFIATTNEITITPAAETNFVLIKNPVASGKLHRSNDFVLTVRTEAQNIRLRIYKNPTVTTDGNLIFVRNVRTSGNTPVSQAFSLPATSSPGQLVASYSRNANSLNRSFDLSLYLEQGESYLITVQGTATGNDYMLTYTFVEE